MTVNNRNLLQRIIFNNSTKSTTRQRSNPKLWDPGFFPLKKIKESIESIAKLSKNKSIIDIGCGDMAYRDLFLHSNNRYVGVDFYSDLPGTLKIDIEKPFFNEKHDIVICSEVLEHCFNYNQVIENIHSNLKEGGTIFISVPFAFEIHGWDYNDYFRFTDQSLNKLFEKDGISFTPTNGYLSTILLKVSQFIFYLPLPYIIKIPFFIIINSLVLLIEYTISILLKSYMKDSLLTKVWFSFPINFYIKHE